jgi:DNA-binding SARP family transcriptional activator
VEIRLLGPLEIRDNSGLTTRITSAKQRVVFAALALRPGEVVSAEHLVDCLWGDNPPATARETVHSHVTRLRRNLPAAERARIVTRAPGYLLDVELSDVDFYRVRDLHRAAATATECGDGEKAVILLDEARNISRGTLLADVDSELLRQRHGPAWEDFRAQLTEARIDAEMALGNHAGVLGELRSLRCSSPRWYWSSRPCDHPVRHEVPTCEPQGKRPPIRVRRGPLWTVPTTPRSGSTTRHPHGREGAAAG